MILLLPPPPTPLALPSPLPIARLPRIRQRRLVTTLIVVSVLFDSTGFLPLQELHNTCKRFNVPAKHDMLRALLEKIERNDRNDANYEQFLKLLNWRDSPGKKLNLAGVLAGWGRKGNVTF